jgi:hypothetical protein
LRAGCTTAPSWVETKRTCRQTWHKGRTWLARRRALGSGHDATVDPSSAGMRFTQHGQQDSARGRRRHSPWVSSGVIAGSVQGVCNVEEEVHDVEVRALLLFPSNGTPARPPRMAPGASTATHRSAPPPSLPYSLPPTFPPSLLLLAAVDQERGKTPMRLGLREGLSPRVVELG